VPADSDSPPSVPPPGGPVPGAVSVIVTVLADPRVERTLESLLVQRRPPLEILVDDGGGPPTVRAIAERLRARDPRVVHLAAPGSISESRNVALAVARGEFVAFLDADEVAPPEWLDRLLAPFAEASVGFVGGPTPGLPATLRAIGARYYDAYLRRLYDRVAPSHPQALPMGNSAWRSRLFTELGPLDTTLDRRAASEDQEFAVRALARGWRGVYAPDAWVYHDFSGLSAWALLRKQRIYARGGYVVWRRHGSTYEARAGHLLPYVLLPALLVVGAGIALIPGLRLVGGAIAAAGALGLLALAVGLTVWGIGRERTYPGMRYAALEILRRWATLVGAFQGLLAYGWSGRRAPPPGRAPPPPASSTRPPSGKP
jgi:cellulose synthase/poly-beta-1,6-N-acetylglucosamine synthase-like glycosyltransferase